MWTLKNRVSIIVAVSFGNHFTKPNISLALLFLLFYCRSSRCLTLLNFIYGKPMGVNKVFTWSLYLYFCSLCVRDKYKLFQFKSYEGKKKLLRIQKYVYSSIIIWTSGYVYCSIRVWDKCTIQTYFLHMNVLSKKFLTVQYIFFKLLATWWYIDAVDAKGNHKRKLET